MEDTFDGLKIRVTASVGVVTLRIQDHNYHFSPAKADTLGEMLVSAANSMSEERQVEQEAEEGTE